MSSEREGHGIGRAEDGDRSLKGPEIGADERRSLLASIIEQSDDALVALTRDGRIASWNRAAETIYGHAAGDAIGRDLSIMISESCPEEASKMLERIARGESVRNYEMGRKKESGETMLISLCISPIRAEDGSIIGASTVSRDVTAEVTAQQAAKVAAGAERKRFVEVLDRLPAYVALLTTDYRISFANRYFREHFGEDHGRHCYECLFGLDAPCEFCESYVVHKTGEPHQWEWSGPDGNIYDVFDYPFVDLDGSKMIMEVGINVTKRKTAEDALRKALAYNRSLIEASLDPLVTIGPDGKITDVNMATESITGRSRAELIGTDFSDYFTEPDTARAGYETVFREGLVRDYALEIRHQDGRMIPVLYNAQVYRDDEGHVIGVFAAARDVTAQKRIEGELAAQRRMELERISDLEKFQRLTVGRELKMVELKKEIAELKAINADLRKRMEH